MSQGLCDNHSDNRQIAIVYSGRERERMEETTDADKAHEFNDCFGDRQQQYQEQQYQYQYQNELQLGQRINGSKRIMGRSRLLCCCVLTNDSANGICIAIFILIIVIIFMIGVVPRGEIFSYIIVSCITLGALICLTLAVAIDPGILPAVSLDSSFRPGSIIVNGREIMCKVCPTCHILRPPRSTHCQFCDYCVEEFDHHCGVIGSCVAKRTFRFFGGFLFFCALLTLYISIRSIIKLAIFTFNLNSSQGRWEISASIISVVIAALAGCIVVPLSWYYIYLACLNFTQKESLRKPHGFCEPNHDFHRGYCCNFWRRYFGPLGNSRINSANANSLV